ncbi:MAG TPA: prepilin-type N-terminal cleavage/methylation domain-containing protein [Gammaproteobacteria bacterium]|nr:prepilin-type N-terminal cleavage/methylation domain-containing protein [Gammaproteobacteria bacterium]
MGNRGFTLVELVMAISIFAILMAIAYPSYRQWHDQSSLDADVMVLKGALAAARSRSIQEGLYWGRTAAPGASGTICNRLYFGVSAAPGASRLGLIYFCDQDSDGDVDAPGEITTWATRSLGNGVAVTASSTLNNNRIWFDKGGEVFKSTGSVWLSVGSMANSVTVANNGRIRE